MLLQLGLSLSLFTVVLGHVLICIPYSVTVLISGFEGFDRSLEEASADLGETAFGTFRRVTLPMVAPAIISSLLVSFTISLDEFIMAFFLTGTEPTLPVYIWGQLRFAAKLPGVLALGTLLLVGSFVLLTIAEILRRRAAAAHQNPREPSLPDRRPMIEIANVTRSYGAFKALDNASLTIREGEFFSLLGPSGCGKTTLLRMIAGFDNPTSGAISIDGQPMDGIPANRRPTNMVFQSYAIFPHLNVEQNVAYGLKRLRLEPAEEKRRVDEALAQVSLAGLGKRGAHRAVGRPAPARGAGPRAGHAAEGAAARRAAVGARQEAARADAGRAAPAAAGGRHHLRPGHPRPVRGARHVRPHRRDVRRQDRAGRLAQGDLPAPGQPPGRRLPRRHELRQGRDRRGERRVDHRRHAGLRPRQDRQAGGLRRATARPPRSASGRSGCACCGTTRRPSHEVAGKVVERHYFGEITHLIVEIPGLEKPLSVSETNDFGADDIPVGAPIRLAYDPDALVAMAD